MKVIFCLSYLSVPQTLSIIEEKSDSDFLIITYLEGLYNFFAGLYSSPKVKLIDNYSYYNLTAITRYFEIRRLRKALVKELKDLGGIEVYFFFEGYALFEASVINKLNGSVKIYYSKSVSVDHAKGNFSLRCFVKKMIANLVYSVDFKPNTNGKYCNIYFKDEFYSQFEKIHVHPRKALSKNILGQPLNLKDRRIILFVGGDVDEGFVYMPEYIEKMDLLIKRIGSTKIALKSHPRYPKKYSMENTVFEIPSYVPGNMIMNNFDFIISYSSAVLFEAANEGKISISLLDYFNCTSESVRRNFKTYLSNNLVIDKEIKYPTNLSEIVRIIKLSK